MYSTNESMLHTPFYDPTKTYEENCQDGPFGAFADGTKFENRLPPQHTFLGQKVFLPFGIAPGPLVNGKFVKAALDKGFDIVAYKTVRTKKHPVHPWPNVVAVTTEKNLTIEQAQNGLTQNPQFQEPLAITNSFGVPSFDPDVWQPDFHDTVAYAKEGQVVVGGFQGTPSGDTATYINDFVLAARLLQEAGAKVLEANLSCPNEGTGHLLCFDIERVKTIAVAIKNEIGNTPLLLKMAYFKEQSMLEQFIREIGPITDGFSMINTIAAKVYDQAGNQALPGEGRLTSGVCGSPIRWAGLDMVSRVKTLREQLGLSFAIVGVGGVTTPADYAAYRLAGADAVECATGAMWNPYLAQEIKQTVSH